MVKKVLLIGEKNSFMVSAVFNELNDGPFLLIRVEPDVREIQDLENVPRIILFYLSDTIVKEKKDLLTFLGNMVAQDAEIRLYILGEKREFDILYDIIPKDHIAGHFTRPLNVQTIASTLERLEQRNLAATSKHRILIVDDDAIILRTMEVWLNDRYNVYMVNSGKDALDFLSSQQVDLILLDYEMPEMSGPEVMLTLQESPELCDIPVMFLTGKNDVESVKTAVILHPVRYILKSSSKDDILSSIDHFFYAAIGPNDDD
ncbi:MAG: response regulator [Lachnospiraceae bacterium]|nr:response regulator [Lachnospiraceae bacterium]